MRICGVGIAGSEAAVVLVDYVDGEVTIVASATTRLNLGDAFDTTAVRNFLALSQTFLREHGVELVLIKKKPSGGDFAAGPGAFVIGAVLQVSGDVPVDFVTAQSISNSLKKKPADLPDGLHKYQAEAFFTILTWIRAQG